MKRRQQYSENIDQFSEALSQGQNAGEIGLSATEQNIENSILSGLGEKANRIASTLQMTSEAELRVKEVARQNREVGRFAELESRFPDLENARYSIAQRE